MKKVKIYALDKYIEHDTSYVYIFSSKYKRKLKAFEYHNPGVAKIIIKTKTSIYQYLFTDIIVESLEDHINIFSNNFYQNITYEQNYYTVKEMKLMESLYKMYEARGLSYLNPDEIIEYTKAKAAYQLKKVMKFKVPYRVGGGF